jgi:thioredoxin 1
MIKMVNINDTQFDTLVLKSAMPVLLEVSSPECIICKTMAERIIEVGKEHASKVVFLILNINENKKWQEYDVRVIPTLLYFKRGSLVARQDMFPDAGEIKTQLRALLGQEGVSAIAAEEVKTAMDLEYASSEFYSHMAANAKNGRMKERFREIEEASLIHNDILQGKLREISGEIYQSSDNPKFSDIDGLKPEGFSLLGALKMAMKIEEKLFDAYKKLQKSQPKIDDALFRKFAKEEAAHLKQLKEEMKFVQDKELFSSIESPGYETWLNKVFE